jgi:hypothetical protein
MGVARTLALTQDRAFHLWVLSKPLPAMVKTASLELGEIPQCVGDRILHTICCSRTMDLGLHIAVHARKKSFLRHTVRLSPKRKGPKLRGIGIVSTHYVPIKYLMGQPLC